MPERDLDTALIRATELDLSEDGVSRADQTARAALAREMQEATKRQPRVRPWRSLAIISSVVLAGGVAAVGYAALTDTSTASDGIGCYSGADLDSDATIVALEGRRATATCADLWADGAVGEGTRAPAPLHACVDAEGSGPIRVVTSADADACGAIGLIEDPNAGTDATARSFAAFSSELNRALEGVECSSAAEVSQLVERLLKTNGLEGWQITASSGSGDSDCASVAVDSDTQTVTVFTDLQ